MSTGTICMSYVVEISHVFQNLLRQERRHMHVWHHKLLFRYKTEKVGWQDIYQQSWPANILCRSLTAADMKPDATINKRPDHFVLVKGPRLT